MNDFDDIHKDFDKHFKSTKRLAVGIIIVNFLLGIGFVGAIVYVIAHFLKKIW